MDERIKKLKTPEACEIFAKNAINLKHPELAIEALRRSIELRAANHNAQNDAEKEALQAVYAYEHLLTEKNGRKTRAIRTWRMIDRHGIIEAVNRAVSKKIDTLGYAVLKAKGVEDLSFEAVVLRYPDVFSMEAVKRAKEKLSELNSSKI